jgi:hypothetical protein
METPPSTKLQKLTADERKLCREQGRCFKCREPGHISKDCEAGKSQKKKSSRAWQPKGGQKGKTKEPRTPTPEKSGSDSKGKGKTKVTDATESPPPTPRPEDEPPALSLQMRGVRLAPIQGTSAAIADDEERSPSPPKRSRSAPPPLRSPYEGNFPKSERLDRALEHLPAFKDAIAADRAQKAEDTVKPVAEATRSGKDSKRRVVTEDMMEQRTIQYIKPLMRYNQPENDLYNPWYGCWIFPRLRRWLKRRRQARADIRAYDTFIDFSDPNAQDPRQKALWFHAGDLNSVIAHQVRAKFPILEDNAAGRGAVQRMAIRVICDQLTVDKVEELPDPETFAMHLYKIIEMVFSPTFNELMEQQIADSAPYRARRRAHKRPAIFC